MDGSSRSCVVVLGIGLFRLEVLSDVHVVIIGAVRVDAHHSATRPPFVIVILGLVQVGLKVVVRVVIGLDQTRPCLDGHVQVVFGPAGGAAVH